MAPISFGIFDHIDRREAPAAQIYEERLQLLEAADQSGFYAFHLAEHHATPLSLAPSPAVFLAAAGQRTRRIRLGALVFMLPAYHPLRLAEEICMLDHLTGGRFDLGVGRGISPFELRFYGVDPERSRDVFAEALQVLVTGMSGPRLTHAGEFYRFEGVPMELQPLQRPYPPLWYPTSSDEGIRWAARNGINVVLAGRGGALRRQTDLYWETWQAHKDDPDRLNGHVAAPKVGANFKVYLAETEAEALAVAAPAQRLHHTSLAKLWRDFGVEPLGAGHTPDITALMQHNAALVGTPARVREQIAEFAESSGCNYLVAHLHFGDMTHAQALRSLHLLAEDVMPAFAEGGSVAAAGT